MDAGWCGALFSASSWVDIGEQAALFYLGKTGGDARGQVADE
jgi:hypothetical protein